MSAPATPVDVCNLALDRLGQAPIASILAPASPSEDVCARQYDQTRRECLREFIPNFARKSALLTTVTDPPTDFDFSNAYLLPNDFVRLLKIGDRVLFGGAVPALFYTLADNLLYCDGATTQSVLDNEGNPVTGLPIRYVYDAITVPKFDSLFLKVLKLQLASNCAYKFTLKSGLKKDLDEELKNARNQAAAVSGQEQPPLRVQRSRIRDVRRSGGIFRNNTVI